MPDNKKEQEREELHRAIWAIADDLRGSVDGWDFKSYVLGIMFYRYISENLTNYINADEIAAGNADFDYILMLVAKYHDSNCEDKEILVDIRKAVDSSMQLRSKKDLIENFIATVNTATKVDDDWVKFVTEQKKTDLDTLIAEEKLKPDETRKFVDNSFRDGILKTTGTDVDRILPPVSRFGGGNRAAKKDGIIAKLQAFFDKYFGLI